MREVQQAPMFDLTLSEEQLMFRDTLQRLAEEARCDQLTGAFNRRGLERFIDAAIESARRGRREITVMVFDIDDFNSKTEWTLVAEKTELGAEMGSTMAVAAGVARKRG